MIILTNCLSDTPDEGCLMIANSLIKRMKTASSGVTVASYDRCTNWSDVHLTLNKLFLNASLFRLLRKKKELVLHIPFPARPIAMAIRVFTLSLACNSGLQVLMTMNVSMGFLSKLLYRMSGAEFVVLSEDIQEQYNRIVGSHRVTRLKTGVDTKKFVPVTREQADGLKKKYGFAPDKKLILHVGHLNRGRNVQQLLKIHPDYQVLLVTSTLTKEEQDASLREELMHAGVRILDDFIPQIQEVYQMADAYFFPVQASGHCIDVPLSCLEAAACGKPVVTTAYREMRSFAEKPGFYFLESFTKEAINNTLQTALSDKNIHPRKYVLEYDWDEAISLLTVGNNNNRRLKL